MSTPSAHPLVVGIDAGGTCTSLCARSGSQQPDLLLHGPAANAHRHGIDHTATVIASLVRKALQQIPGSALRAVYAGVAGAGTPEVSSLLTSRIQGMLQNHPECRVSVTHDGDIALEAAFEGQSGVLIIAGTGSAVFASLQTGETVRYGGWGPLIGDEGSGYTIGRLGLAAAAHAIDGGDPTQLTRLFREQFGISSRPSLLQRISDKQWPVQQVAPVVLSAASEGDAVADVIVTRQTRALSLQVAWLLGQHPGIRARYSISGGLSQSAYYMAQLQRQVQDVWPEGRWQAPLDAPLEGAVRLAQQSLTGYSAR